MNRSNPQSWAIFPDKRYNPLLPLIPGAPGLMYTGRLDVTEHRWRLFRKQDGPVALYKYLGEYDPICVGILTRQEFASQNRTVRD